MSVWCSLCKQLAEPRDAQQLIPCLHTFCIACLQKINAKKAKVCPMKHCMSALQSWPEIKFNTCESSLCRRKATPVQEMFTAVCTHSLCMDCVDQAKKWETPICPVVDCSSPLIDIDETEQCGGECKAALDPAKLKTLSCCQVRMCAPCAEKWTEGKDICPLGKCQPADKKPKKTKKSAAVQEKVICSGDMDCDGQVLPNFPSDGECDHAVCMNCLNKTLDECEKNNKPPICPADICRITYHCDSVLALREMFPKRIAYFNRFDLSSHFSGEISKDDQFLTLKGSHLSGYYQKAKLAEIRVAYCEDEDNVYKFNFDLNGTLGDFLREIRRVLKILPFDRVYGYLRRDADKEKPLDVSPSRMNATLTKLKIDKDTLILVNITGVVSSK